MINQLFVSFFFPFICYSREFILNGIFTTLCATDKWELFSFEKKI